MHIKFHRASVRHKTARDTADYLLADRDHQGIRRASVKVLRGDPYKTAAVADSLDFRRCYTNGVIAWAPEDAPTDEQISEVLDQFEQSSWAGLDPDRYLWSAVEHRDNVGGVHVHVITARVDLETGKAMNIAPPGWQKTYDPLRDHFNYKYGWARPDDWRRARVLQPGYQAYIDAAAIRAGIEDEESKEDPRILITRYLVQHIEAGTIEDRAGIIAALEKIGVEIPRQGRDYITVREPSTGEKWRLRGVIYGRNFKREDFTAETETEDDRGSRADRAVDPVRAAEAFRELQKTRRRRAEYNRGRYRVQGKTAEALPPTASDCGAGNRNESFGDRLRRELGSAALDIGPDPVPDGAADRALPGDRQTAAGAPAAPGPNVGREPLFLEGWTVRGIPPGNIQSVESQRADGRPNNKGEIDHDRTRTAFDRSIAGIVRTVRDGATAALRACGALERAGRAIERAGAALKRGVAKMIENSGDEIQKFKKEICLTAYAATLGYEIDRKASSKNSVVMRGPGEDKIIVATDPDGHGIYFSVRDSRDHGTIVDFVQKRKALNFGQVRKELRPWIGIGSKPPEVDSTRYQKPTPTTRDHQGVLWKWQQAKVLTDYQYLNPHGLTRADLAAVGVDDMTKMDERGNVMFGLYDEYGLCGYEIKNRDFAGFAKGGQKGLWVTRPAGDVGRIVIAESAIDALSYAKLFPDDAGTLYSSFGGAWSKEQLELIKRFFGRYPKARIIAAVDNDEGGDEFTAAFEKLAPGRVERHSPDVRGNDWNDVLKKKLGLQRRRQGMERSTTRSSGR